MNEPITHNKHLASLADQLVKASNHAERVELLVRHPGLDRLSLANRIKEICYESWASEPTIVRRTAAALSSIEKRVSSPEITAIMYWTRGISEITKGRLESALENLDRSAEMFQDVDNRRESARCKVAAVLALAMLGRYDEANEAGSSALKIFLEIGDGLAAAKIELNLSNIAFRRERHLESEKLYLSAIKRFTKLGEREWKTMAENGLANAYAEIGATKKADRYYRCALEGARAAGMLVTEAEIQASIGNLYRSRGEYRDALSFLESSRVIFERLDMPHQSAIAELEIADIYAELNLNAEALQAYEALTPILKKLKLRAEEARARVNFGRVLHVSGRTPDARRHLRTAIRLYKLEGNMAGEAMAWIVAGAIDNELGNFDAALESVQSAETLLKGLRLPRRSLNAAWLRAEIDRKSGGTGSAIAFQLVLSNAKRLSHPALEISALCSLAKIAEGQGKSGLAANMFRRAIKVVETLRAPLPGEEFRRAIVADKMGPYDGLAQLYISQGKLRKAFQTVERSRSRSLDEMIENYQTRTSDADSFLEIRKRLNWNYSRSEMAEGEEFDRLQSQSLQLEKQLSELRRRQQSSSRGTSLPKSESQGVNVAALQSKLGKDRAFIEYVSFKGEISAFVVTDRKLRFFSAISTNHEIGSWVEEFHYQIASLRFGSENIGAFSGILKRKADNTLHQLHKALIEPLQDDLEDRHLVISPSQVLNYVPFAALFDGSQYLIQTREIVQAPSGAIWFEMARRVPRKFEPAVLIGFADEKIPLVNNEIETLADLLSSPVVLTGSDASFQAFKSESPRAGLLHVACHGNFRPDNPMYSSLRLSDGWVTVSDVVSMKLKAELVSLSACETGINKIYPGEEVVGLARGFLAAGASNVILSLWNVNDKATRKLMVDLYSSIQRKCSIAASLRQAQRQFIQRGEHPYYWAPFILIGR